MGIAADLDMDTSPGSEAERIARREARRMAAGFPVAWNDTREASPIDVALELFAPMTLVSFTAWAPAVTTEKSGAANGGGS